MMEQKILPTGDEIYDEIMGQIEPDLTSARIEQWDTKYRDETPEEHEIRMEHYDRALELYDEARLAYASGVIEVLNAMESEGYSYADRGRLLDDLQTISQLQ